MTVGTLPANRFNDPDLQFCDTTGLPYAGGFLFFFASSSSTPQDTFNDPDLDSSHANTNPVVLDSAGRAGPVWLQKLPYKVVLQNSDGVQIWAADPVYTSDYSTVAQFQVYPGNPNTHVAGTAGSGSVPSSAVWDTADNILYVCTTTGVAAAAVWTSVTGAFPSGIAFSGVITPTTLAADTNNWAPTGFSGAYTVRASASSAINLTGLAGGASGRDILVSNVGANNITLVGNSASSTASNRFLLDADLVLLPTEAVSLSYDQTSSGWRRKDPTSPLLATQAQQETGTATGVYVAPAVQQFHLSAAKCWAYITVSAGTPTLATSYNITSIADTATGQCTITIATDFSSSSWASSGLVTATDHNAIYEEASKAAGSVIAESRKLSDLTTVDPLTYAFIGFGDQ